MGVPNVGIKNCHENISQGKSMKLELNDPEKRYVFHVDGESYLVEGRHVIEIEYNSTINVMKCSNESAE